MATNDFITFAASAGANVLTNASYVALADRLNGFASGIASSTNMNKVWRQSSIMATVLAQFIADITGANSVDDGSTATLLANLKIAGAQYGTGQVWTTFAIPGARASGTTYTNSTGRAIQLLVQINMNAGLTVVVNGVTVISVAGANLQFPVAMVIPNGATYSITAATAITFWNEFR
jgi:hypothetical protein